MISVIILAIVFILIAVRQLGNIRLQIWQIMLLGAVGVLITRQISPSEALKAINPDVMFFLFGVFIIGQALEESGYLSQLSYTFFKRAKSVSTLVLYILFGMGMLSAFLMNDTVAIIGTPVVLALARNNDLEPKMLLLSLAFAITIGSVTSPIGNPQNLLIALHDGITNPFITFLKFLLLPTVINLLVAYLLLRVFYRRHFHRRALDHAPSLIKDARLATMCKVSLIMLFVLVVAKIAMVFLDVGLDFKLTYIALVSALPIILFSPRRFQVIRKIDWFTLIFFAAMFVLMESVWQSGFFQSAINALHLRLTSTGAILSISTVLSQLISNVPLVALYLPILNHLAITAKELMALAAGSTIAGNLTILGAASNVIIIQNAEKRGATITFFEFVKIGVPLTVINLVVYWLFISLC
jgi:Na+/H+ antiporter NhaD/arsenite permease-like protein